MKRDRWLCFFESTNGDSSAIRKSPMSGPLVFWFFFYGVGSF